MFRRIKFSYLFIHPYLTLAPLVSRSLLLKLRPPWNNVEIKLYQHCFNVGHRVVSALSKIENLTSDFVSFLTSDQRYFNVDRQRNNIDPTLKCWLGSHNTNNLRIIGTTCTAHVLYMYWEVWVVFWMHWRNISVTLRGNVDYPQECVCCLQKKNAHLNTCSNLICSLNS